MSEDSDLHNVFTQAKEDRRRAEQDVKVLANRIALLKAADARAQRKITETKKKAAQVEVAKQRTAQKNAEKLK